MRTKIVVCCATIALFLSSFLRNTHTHTPETEERKKKKAHFKFEHFQQALNSSQFRVCVPYKSISIWCVAYFTFFFVCFLSLYPSSARNARVMIIALLFEIVCSCVSWHRYERTARALHSKATGSTVLICLIFILNSPTKSNAANNRYGMRAQSDDKEIEGWAPKKKR